MSKFRLVIFSLGLFLSVLLGFTAPAFAHTGHTDWIGWSFDWEVKDDAGIALRNLRFNNELVLYKASLPVIRVKYLLDGDQKGCGPFQDRINWDNLLNISENFSNCGNGKVCQKTYTSGGHNWLELGVLAGIGKYRIYQAWYLSEDGWIEPRMWSKGLHCNIDHKHHPYWRLDFDVAGAAWDQIFVYDQNRRDEGWGAGWHKYTNELNDLKNPETKRVWFVRDNPTAHGVQIIPSKEDGSVDAFSRIDIGLRTYHNLEDKDWPFGATGELAYDDNENIQEKDIVFWYVPHLNHIAADGAENWHFVGPFLHVSR